MRVTRSNPAGAGKNGPRRRIPPPDLEALAQLSGRITALEAQEHDPKRRSVYIDGQFAIGLHEETIILARLKVGLQVNGPVLLEALKRDIAKRAWDDALVMLSAVPRSCREVERRLTRKYPPDVAASVVERLVGGGWLNDAEFARSYIRSHGAYGERRLLQDLARKGVAREVAAGAVQELLGQVDVTEQAREAAAQRLNRMPGVDRDTAQRRLAGFLARRGYGFDIITRVLGPLLQELPRAPRPERQQRSGWGRGGGMRRRGPETQPDEEG
jgi:regulatory protein